MPEAELARLRRAEGDVRVLRQLGARIEGEQEAALEVEKHNGSGRVLIVTHVLRRDHSLGLESEALAVEGERAVEIRHRQGDHVDTRDHRPALTHWAGSGNTGHR